MPASPGPITRDGAHRAAADELARATYHRDDPGLLQRFPSWLFARLSHVFRLADGTPKGIVGIVLLLVVVLVAVVVVRLRLGRLPVRDLFTDRTPGSTLRSAADLRQEADALAAQGEWANAVRIRTRAVVRDLESRGIVDPRPGTTLVTLTGQAARRLPSVAAELRLVARLFDEVWYADVPATADTDARLRQADQRISTARASAETAAPAGSLPPLPAR